MTTYRLYQEARNAAWRTLSHFSCYELPIAPAAIAEKLRIPVLPFPDSGEEPKLYALVRQNPRAVAVSLQVKGIWHIFHQNDLPEEYAAFAIAHELGHIILHHAVYSPAAGIRAFIAGENEGDILDNPQELEDYAADIFAVRFLAPACVLHEMHVDSPGEIARLCRLPRKAALLRGERRELLNQRNVFYADPLEKQVMRQFLPYIRAYVPPVPVSPVPAYIPAPAISAPMPKAPESVKTEAPAENGNTEVIKPRKNSRNMLLIFLLAFFAAAFIILAACGVFR